MQTNFYGKIQQVENINDIDLYVEEITNDGFAIVDNVLTLDELQVYREKIDFVYEKQKEEFGHERLKLIKEENMCRMPLKYDDYFIHIATNTQVLEIVKKF